MRRNDRGKVTPVDDPLSVDGTTLVPAAEEGQ